MGFLKFIFYSIAVMFLVHEILWLLSPKDSTEESKKLALLSKEHKGKKYDEYSNVHKNLLLYKGIPSLTLTVWTIAGLFTFNWIAFLIYIILQFLIITPISRMFNYNIVYIVLHFIGSILGVLLGLFVMINSSHLKIDLFTMLKSILW